MKTATLIKSVTAASIIAALGSAQTANADTIKAQFTYTLSKTLNVTSPVSDGNVNTVKFEWTRKDSAGPGVDANIGSPFNTYCVDLAQYVSANTNYTYNVVSPAAHGFTSNQETLLARLWATQFDNIDTVNESAAFQVAVWEITYDTNLNLSTGSFKLNDNATIRTLAQGWIDTISSPSFSYNGTLPTLFVLESSTAQDQLTAVPTNVPAAGSGMLALAGMSLLGKRRARK